MEGVDDDVLAEAAKLADPNKVQRKRSLEKMSRLIAENPDRAATIWSRKDACLAVVRCLQDESERCRELAAEVAAAAVASELVAAADRRLNYVLPVICRGLSSIEDRGPTEPSEEVRLGLATMLLRIAERTAEDGQSGGGDLRPYLDEICSCLKSSLVDPFAEVRAVSATCILSMASGLKTDFHLAASSLVEPLIKCFAHQQKKVRLSAVVALGVVLQHSSSETFKQAVPHLAQRLFDTAAEVRLNVSRIAYELLLSWDYKEVNSPFLVPLLLTSLEDEVAETRSEAWTMWTRVGEEWVKSEASRDARVKEMLEFPLEPPSHYPPQVDRPSFGCRLLVSRLFHKLLPALERDLRDWLVETRIKTAKLTYVLMMHLEDGDVVAHVPALVTLMKASLSDEDPIVVAYMCKSATLIGYFAPSDCWCPLVCKQLQKEDTVSAEELCVLRHLVAGSNPDLLRKHLENLALVLEEDKICLTMNNSVQAQLQACCESILNACDARCIDVKPPLFKILLTSHALSSDSDLKVRALELLGKLAALFHNDDTHDLFKHEMCPLLKHYQETCSSWGPDAYDAAVFAALLERSGDAAGFFTQQIVGIFRIVLGGPSPKSSPELQLKMLMVLSRQLLGEGGQNLDSQKQFGSYAQFVITEILRPHLKWHPGKKAAAVRIAASTCLWSLLHKRRIDAPSLARVLDDLVPVMNGLTEDGNDKVRAVTCRSFRAVMEIMLEALPAPVLWTAVKFLVLRLDDSCEEVRVLALEALEAVPLCVSSAPTSTEDADLGYRESLQRALKTVMLHMDDQSIVVRTKALETLRSIGRMDPLYLEELVNLSTNQHKHKEEVRMLNEHLQSLAIK